MQCQPDKSKHPFEYAIGKEYDEDSAELCDHGFHACENPMDVFLYYSPADGRYCEVDLDATDERGEDSKRCGKKIRLVSEIGIDGIIKAGVKVIFDKVDFVNSLATNTGYRSAATNTGNQSAATNTGDWSAATNTGDRSAATNTGDQSAATNTGKWSAATNTGDRSAATNTGYRSAATNTGDRSAATNTGYQSAATNTGYRSAATNTGDRSAATNTGNQSAATNTGKWSAATVSGKESVACSTGYDGKAKGAVGCWLVLAEWERGHRIDVQCFHVDGQKIKADSWYMLKKGKPVEVE